MVIFRHPQSLHVPRGLTYHIANTLVSGRYCIRNEQQCGLIHIWPCLSCQRSWLPFTPDCKFWVKLFWDIIVIQTPLLTMVVFISCLLKDTYCIDLTNFIPSILTYMQFYSHSVQWGGGKRRGGGVLIIGLLFIYKASYILVPRVFPTRSSLGDVCPSRGWTCRPDKSEQSECRHLSSKVRQLTGPNTVLFRDDLYTDRLFGSGSIMPSCYALFPRTK